MDIHDKMVEELFKTKSLNALIYLIEHGRELEFKYNDIECFISKDHSSGFVSIWVDKKEQAFDSIEELIANAEIDNALFEDIWRDITLGVLF